MSPPHYGQGGEVRALVRAVDGGIAERPKDGQPLGMGGELPNCAVNITSPHEASSSPCLPRSTPLARPDGAQPSHPGLPGLRRTTPNPAHQLVGRACALALPRMQTLLPSRERALRKNPMTMLDLKMLNDMPEHTCFATGTGEYPSAGQRELPPENPNDDCPF